MLLYLFKDAGDLIPTTAQDGGILSLYYAWMLSRPYGVLTVAECEEINVCTVHRGVIEGLNVPYFLVQRCYNSPPVILVPSGRSHFRWMAKAQNTPYVEISITCDLQSKHSVHMCCMRAIIVIGCGIIYSYTRERCRLYSGQWFLVNGSDVR